MEALVDKLLRLEKAKHEALILIDAPAYDTVVSEQVRLVADARESLAETASLERLLALSQLVTLNTRLLRDLLSTGSGFNVSGKYKCA